MTSVATFIRSIEGRVIIDKDNGEEIRFVKADPVSREVLDQAEQNLGIPLPDSYKAFLAYCGAADFCRLKMWTVPELYAFDEDTGEMEGMIPFTTDFQERWHVFKPAPDNKEYEVYICSHDPFGYGKVADNFLEWCKLQNDLMLNFETGENDFKHPFIEVDEEIFACYKRYKASLPKKWWQFRK